MINPDINIVAVDDVTWTPLYPTMDCLQLAILNDTLNDLLFRKLDTDPNTQITIYSKTERTIYQSVRNMMLHKSQVIGYLKFVSGVGNVSRICTY